MVVRSVEIVLNPPSFCTTSRVLCEKHGGEWRPNKARAKKKAAAANDSTSEWRKNFISAPYIRDALALKGERVWH